MVSVGSRAAHDFRRCHVKNGGAETYRKSPGLDCTAVESKKRFVQYQRQRPCADALRQRKLKISLRALREGTGGAHTAPVRKIPSTRILWPVCI